MLSWLGLKKKPVAYLVAGMVFELCGALFRIIADIDPLGCLRILPTSYGNIFVISGSALTLVDCLLFTLYLHETSTLKTLKVNTWITKTSWLFYLLSAIMLVISIINALARLTELYDLINIVSIIVLAVINIIIGIFFAITSANLLKDVKSYDVDPVYVKKLSTRLWVTCIFFLLWMIIIFLAVTPIGNVPLPHAILSMLLKTSFATICIINMISIINAKRSGKPSSQTKKTKTSTKSSGGTNDGETNVGSLEEDPAEDVPPESKSEELDDDDDE